MKKRTLLECAQDELRRAKEAVKEARRMVREVEGWIKDYGDEPLGSLIVPRGTWFWGWKAAPRKRRYFLKFETQETTRGIPITELLTMAGIDHLTWHIGKRTKTAQFQLDDETTVNIEVRISPCHRAIIEQEIEWCGQLPEGVRIVQELD